MERLHQILPEDIDVTLLADREFGEQKLFVHLAALGWHYEIRFRQLIKVTHDGETKPAGECKLLHRAAFPFQGRRCHRGPA